MGAKCVTDSFLVCYNRHFGVLFFHDCQVKVLENILSIFRCLAELITLSILNRF